MDRAPDQDPIDVGRAAVERLRAAAEADLAAAAGDLSLCAIGRSGRSFPGVKYHEGRTVALASIARAMGAGTGLHRAIADVDREFVSLEALAAADPEWDAYRQGGLDALHELEAAVRTDAVG